MSPKGEFGRVTVTNNLDQLSQIMTRFQSEQLNRWLYHCVTAPFKFLVDPPFKPNLYPLFEGKIISPWKSHITFPLKNLPSSSFFLFLTECILYIVWPITFLRLISTSRFFSARGRKPFFKADIAFEFTLYSDSFQNNGAYLKLTALVLVSTCLAKWVNHYLIDNIWFSNSIFLKFDNIKYVRERALISRTPQYSPVRWHSSCALNVNKKKKKVLQRK